MHMSTAGQARFSCVPFDAALACKACSVCAAVPQRRRLPVRRWRPPPQLFVVATRSSHQGQGFGTALVRELSSVLANAGTVRRDPPSDRLMHVLYSPIALYRYTSIGV